jgi:serine/threonine protein kinase
VNKGLPAMAGDVWAMGVTLYGMAFGYLPFTAKTLIELYESIREQKQQYPKDADPKLVSVLDKLLKKNPDERITIKELREDAWVTDDKKKPLIPFEENCQCADIVITQSDLDAAVQKVGSPFVVLKAYWKFKSLLKRNNKKS